jgi:hypothetical protein
MIMSCVSSGPFALALTSRTLQRLTQNTFLKVFRRAVLAFVNLIGIFLSTVFLIEPIPYLLKIIALFSLLLNVWAIDREYGRRITNRVKRALRRDPNGPAGQS